MSENEEKKTPQKLINSGWNFIDFPNSTGFSLLNDELRNEINENSLNTYYVIIDIFEKLIEQCGNNFDFSNNSINFEQYLDFFQKVNLMIPKLSHKIIIEDIHEMVYFIGDTHGAIKETYQLIQFFVRKIRIFPKLKIIFVGDYVDRNPNDLENLALILSFSLLYPENVILIRGNHEDRLINQHYGFMDNLLRTFYNQAEYLYDEIIQIFMKFPIAHISQIHSKDGKTARVLTVHGGIPIDHANFLEPVILDEIKDSLICEVEESKDMDPYTTSMLWSDPDEMIRGILTGDHLQGRTRFGAPVFDAFMQGNHLDLLVRGHQKWSEGFKILFGGRLYSLFSTASYDGKPRFQPKILKLIYGKAPKLISIEKNSLDSELEEK
ncbi:hypothetical protein NEF87_002804 [Candidatus Lokiarchaeum ossiferum]|uniref:Serine/threonine specific protein phosphatases domain-containing protein n=1 Tax=Candidatus Lokiarchaeum ossiferum TaxID=2951803 RepID=A0ABY6HVD3_9ARCH|nr:hypothetical protein NEF87_002804 [Candidatus Lokiarchaeum sp. B-35]